MMLTLAQLSAAGVNTYFVPKDFSEPGYWIDYAELDGVMLAHLSRARTGFIYEPAKRLLDVAAAAVSLAVLAPLLCVIAVLVKLTRLDRFCSTRTVSEKMATGFPCTSSAPCFAACAPLCLLPKAWR